MTHRKSKKKIEVLTHRKLKENLFMKHNRHMSGEVHLQRTVAPTDQTSEGAPIGAGEGTATISAELRCRHRCRHPLGGRQLQSC